MGAPTMCTLQIREDQVVESSLRVWASLIQYVSIQVSLGQVSLGQVFPGQVSPG